MVHRSIHSMLEVDWNGCWNVASTEFSTVNITRENDPLRWKRSFWGSETIAPATQKQRSHSPLTQGHIRPWTHFIQGQMRPQMIQGQMRPPCQEQVPALDRLVVTKHFAQGFCGIDTYNYIHFESFWYQRHSKGHHLWHGLLTSCADNA